MNETTYVNIYVIIYLLKYENEHILQICEWQKSVNF